MVMEEARNGGESQVEAKGSNSSDQSPDDPAAVSGDSIKVEIKLDKDIESEAAKSDDQPNDAVIKMEN
jgi:hypothetical protein